ncbi:MAG: PRC-barrel domain-containing protein, partial [Pseudoclavibacter sp.]|nr:PRC-barrel domain-containing protein [Pseudoclavibacter sp.]
MSYQDANVPDGPRPDRFAADAHGYGDEGLLSNGQAQETEAGLTAARAESAAMAEQLAAQQERLTRLFTATVVGSDGERIGKVGQVYLDDQTQEPNWVTVKTGLFGT